MKRTSRKPSKLSSSVQRHLNAYAIAASAAGVGLLALTQPAEAKIIYTKTNHLIKPGNYRLDLNHDDIIDFRILWHPNVGKYFSLLVLPAKNKSKDQIWGAVSYTCVPQGSSCPDPQKFYAASALSSGVSVGPNSVKFQAKNNWMWGRCDACGPTNGGETLGRL